jgi:hypothetical protein
MNRTVLSEKRSVVVGDPRLITAEDFIEKLRGNGCTLNRYVHQVIAGMIPRLMKYPATIRMGFASVEELGFHDGSSRAEVIKAILARGFDLLPPETGAYHFFQRGKQSYEARFHLAMEPIVVPGIGPFGFFVVGDSLSCANADDGASLMPDCVWAYRT